MTSDAPRRRRARKRFGQHFLEPAWARKVVAAIAPRPRRRFLEIGPGRGALTRPLAARARRVIAFEIDRDLAADARRAAPDNLSSRRRRLPRADDRGLVEHSAASGGRVRVAGNLPYNVASPILFRLVELHAAGVPLVDATVMLQREVADRLLAEPGTKRLRRADAC